MTAFSAGSLPVATSSELWPVVVMGMGGTPSPRDKAAPTGEMTYSSGAVLMLDRNGEMTAQKSASVHVLNPAPLDMGTMYAAQGRVWVQPYEANSRVALSITVERLVPVSQVRQAGTKDA